MELRVTGGARPMQQLERKKNFELDRVLVEQVLDRALSRGADFAEIFA